MYFKSHQLLWITAITAYTYLGCRSQRRELKLSFTGGQPDKKIGNYGEGWEEAGNVVIGNPIVFWEGTVPYLLWPFWTLLGSIGQCIYGWVDIYDSTYGILCSAQPCWCMINIYHFCWIQVVDIGTSRSGQKISVSCLNVLLNVKVSPWKNNGIFHKWCCTNGWPPVKESGIQTDFLHLNSTWTEDLIIKKEL